MAFLATKSSMDIVKHSGEGFNPVVDGVFLTDHPWTLYQSGHVNPVNAIIGFNSDEGIGFVLAAIKANSIVTPAGAREFLKKLIFRWFVELDSKFFYVSYISEYINLFPNP